MKKAFEVVMAVTGSHEDRERIVFVAAKSKRELANANDVKRVYTRYEMKAGDCPYELVGDTILSK